ncbi:MAG: PAS domain S-box protein [Halofilum sp. (in: g-proteobacteria)]|nr:PAS domain S-box protein [Halofilum sp. (in: g-proteobacteria)]
MNTRLEPDGPPVELRLGTVGDDRHLVAIAPPDPPPLLGSAIARASGVGLALMDAEGRYRYVNPAYCRMYGYRRDELLGQRFTMVIPPGEHDKALANHRAALAAGTGLNRELRVRRRDGSEMTVDSSSRRITLPGGESLRLATVTDVTGIRAGERRLAETESRLRGFAESLPGAVYQFRHEADGSSRFSYMSRGLHGIAGFPPDFPLDDFETFIGLVAEEDRPRLKRAIAESEHTLEPMRQEFRLLTPAGTLWVEARSTPIQQPDGSVVCNGFIDDITDRVLAKHALAEEHHLLDEIVRTSVSALLITDTAGRIVHANPHAHAMLGFEEKQAAYMQELPGRLTETDGTALVPARYPLQRVLDAGEAVEDMRFALCWPGGSRQYLSVNGSPVPGHEGAIERIVFSFADRTGEEEARARLERQNALFHAIFEDSSETVIVTDPERRMIMVNRAFTELFGYSEDEVKGQPTRLIYASADDHRRVGESYAQRSAGDRSRARTHTVRFRSRAGREFIAETVTDILHDTDGNEIGYVGFIRDITERKRAEEELQRQQELYAGLVESTSAILWEGDPETFQFTFVSGEAENLLGYPVSRWTEEPRFWVEHIHPDDREWAPAYCQRATRELRRHSFDYRMIAADGRTVWLRDIVTVVVEDDRPARLVGAMIDITETKEAERELARSEARYRELYHRTPVMLHSIDPDGRLLAVSGFWLQHLGYTEEEVLGRKSIDFFTEESARRAREQVIPEMFRTGRCRNEPYQVVRADGEVIDVLLSAEVEHDASGNVLNTLTVMTDVTEQRRAESEYREIFNNATEGIYRTSPEGRFVRANPALVAMAGFETEQELLAAVTDLGSQWYVNPEDRDRITERLDREGRVQGFECEIYRPGTGERIWVTENARAVRDERGRVAYYEGTVFDITERVRKDQELARSEARFRALYHDTPVMLHSTDADGVIVDVNQYWLSVLGFERDEVVGHRITDFLTDASRERAEREYMPAVFADGAVEELEYRLRRKDGEIREVLLSSSAVRDEQGRIEGLRSVLTDITERRRLEAEYRDLFENSSEGMYRSTPEGELLRANPALARMHGFDTPDELLAAVSDLNSQWYVDPDARAEMQRQLHDQGYVDGFEAEVRALNVGSRLWTSETVHVSRDVRGNVLYYEGLVRDITAERKARDLVRQRNAVLEMIARDDPVSGILYEVVGVTEQQHERVTVAIFRLQDGRVHSAAAPGLDSDCIEAIDGAVPAEIGGAIAEALAGEGKRVAREHFDGGDAQSPFAAAARAAGYDAMAVTPIRDQTGTVLGVLAAFAADASALDQPARELLHEMAQIASIAIEQHRLSEALLRQAQYDPLTELPNRALLSDRLELAIREAERSGHAVGVLLLDLDEFKLINDSLGHSAGDELLQKVSARLRNCLRAADTVARLGGDEFVLVVPLHNSPDYCTDIAERVLSALQRTFRVAEREVTARPSIGISTFPQDGRTPEALLQAADTAMYAAKNAGKNRYRYFAESMNRQVSERLQIESELQDALKGDEFELYYQPRVSLVDGAISGAEGLVRWCHPERGLLNPGAFIDVAERSPLITEIDRVVLEHAARRAAGWQKGGRELLLSVNLSARELHADGFAADVAGILERLGVDPAGIELEITESMLMQDFERASRQLVDLKERAPGLHIAIDDFGSGYSSLNYLRHLPVDTLKIDRSFVVELEHARADDTAAAIAKTIVELAHNLQMSVVAEGVEHRRQLRLLQEFGCEEAQGFLFERPLPIDEFEARLRAGDGYRDIVTSP